MLRRLKKESIAKMKRDIQKEKICQIYIYKLKDIRVYKFFSYKDEARNDIFQTSSNLRFEMEDDNVELISLRLLPFIPFLLLLLLPAGAVLPPFLAPTAAPAAAARCS